MANLAGNLFAVGHLKSAKEEEVKEEA